MKHCHKKKTEVGVFMDQNLEEVKDIAKEVQVDVIQLHGAEDAKFLEELQKLLPVTLTTMENTMCCLFCFWFESFGEYLFGCLCHM